MCRRRLRMCIDISLMVLLSFGRLILGLQPANERLRHKVTSSLIGWAHTKNQPCVISYKLGIVRCFTVGNDVALDIFRGIPSWNVLRPDKKMLI